MSSRVATTGGRAMALAGTALTGTGVVFGAFGAHAWRTHLETQALAAWETAVLYQLVHGLALLALAALGADSRRRWGLQGAAGALGVGTVLFSGSIYALSLGAPGWLGPVTPVGGGLLILGWLIVALWVIGSD